jgi:hypothetical protein
MNNPRILTILMAIAVVVAGAARTVASTLTLIPIPSWLAGTNVNEGRAITSDGKYVVGMSGTSSAAGFLYDVNNNRNIQPNAAGAVPSVAMGVAYRTDPTSGQNQLIIDGLSSGIQTDWMTADGGTNWGALRQDAGFGPASLPAANSLGAAVGSDKFYQIVRNSTQRELYTNQGSNTWNSVTAPTFINNLSVELPLGVQGNMNGVTPNGRAVGQRRVSNVRNNYVIEYPPSEGTAFFFNGLAGDGSGEAFSVSADGNTVFGRSPKTVGGSDLYGYKVVNPGPSQTLNALPEFGNTGGSTSRCVPYCCTADGKLAVGMNFRGLERAVLWNTSDANPANWTIVDLTDLATSGGILVGFTNLHRAYSVGKNAAGDPVITGVGTDASGFTRAFVMVISSVVTPQPQITSITGAGTGSVTVNYTNTLTGTNYTLQYNTNLNTGNWYDVGTASAGGTSASQTDMTAIPGESQRYYRVRTP